MPRTTLDLIASDYRPPARRRSPTCVRRVQQVKGAVAKGGLPERGVGRLGIVLFVRALAVSAVANVAAAQVGGGDSAAAGGEQ